MKKTIHAVRSKHIQADTGRFWDGVEIREAETPLRVMALPVDVDGAKRKDWGNCVFAKACKRLFGSTRVAFFRRTAYVQLKDETGKDYVERYSMPDAMRAQIETFDKTGKMPPGGFVLRPVLPSERLPTKAQRERESKARKKSKGKAVISGTKRENKKSAPLHLDWRTGTGKVHFNSTKEPVIPAK